MKAFKVYPFNLAAGGNQVILAEGSYVRVKSATGDVALTLDDIGPFAPVSVGQGFDLGKTGGGFKRVTLTDVSGAANVGTLIVADASFVDQTLAGVMSVIDGEQARALAGSAFTAGIIVPAVAGQNAYAQIWNPGNSGKNLVIQNASMGSSTAVGLFAFFRNTACATPATGTPFSKKADLALGVGQAKQETLVAAPTSESWAGFCAAATLTPWTPKGGLIVPPGFGFTVGTNTNNAPLYLNVEWYEINVT